MSHPSAPTPTLLIGNRQRTVPLDVAVIEHLAAKAVPLCLRSVGQGQAVLAGVPEVEIALVSDRVIAQVHRRFMNAPGATDVITFAHGELVVSAVTAAKQARELGEIVEREVLRYIVHGLLHLNGHEDADAADAAEMWRVQEMILAEVWPGNHATTNPET